MELARNIPLFIAFRVLFNARFYYPVLGVLFLDLGLTLEQYSLLNVAWAVAIVTLEVPSGALADVIGRKRMVVLAAGMMVAEMLLFALAPVGRPGWLFALLLLNRILSGAAEASASGADEALAYDSLPPAERKSRWPRVLERLMRWQSGAFFVAMIVGALLYDPAAVRVAARFFGSDWEPAPEQLVRWPVYLTLVSAFFCLAVALQMREPRATGGAAGSLGSAVRLAWRNVRTGARTVLADRRILLVLLAALTCDSLVRLFLTFEANYLRLIRIPEFLFGLIGALLALLGFAAAPAARWMVERLSPARNFIVAGGLILTGLVGAAFAPRHAGVWVNIPLGLAMSLAAFFVSHYLNLWITPDTRATVLSFRGVALNLAYGTAGLLFAALTGHLRASAPGEHEETIFGRALVWLPAAFALISCLVLAAALVFRREARRAAGSADPV